MSKAARNIMAKYGWKDGEGLGKDKEGVSTYVKVVRRDPKVATGLGHVAEAGGATEAATSELDHVYRSLKSKEKKYNSLEADEKETRKRDRSHSSSSSSSSNSSRHSPSSSSDSSDEDDGKPLTDAELFRRCGGVRLGRGGRHRFFDGKLERVARSHKS